MNTFSALVILATLAAGGSPSGLSTSSTQPDVFREIEARYQRGELDVDRYHLYRVRALRRPSRLPADLRQLQGRSPVPSGTRYLVEGFQHVVRTGDYGGELHDLLQPPPDHQYVLESTIWPIRVSYTSAGQAAYAQAVLDAADLSYEVQINDFGFYQPVMEPGYEPYRFYVEDAGQGIAGYTAPYDMNPATPYATCFTYIVIDPNLGMDGVGPTVAHEINHSMQASMDCLEVITFWENTAVFMEGLTHPDWLAETYWFIPHFQNEPWRALDYFQSGSGYPYGGVLWMHYLADQMAPTDAGLFARELWEACMQYDWNINEPDYYDAIETVAAARGADASSMEALVIDFAEARYFISDNDDGQHLTGADVFPGAEPTVSARHSAWDLPLVEEAPPAEQRPAPFGTNFVALDLEGESLRPLIVGFDGDNDTRWAVRVVLLGDGSTTLSQTITLNPDTWYGQLVVDPTGFDELLLVVVNLGDEDYEPDPQIWPVSNYYYSLEEVRDPPTVIAVAPAAVVRGRQNLHVRLVGADFVYGTEFAVVFDDPMFDVVSIDALSSTEVMFTLTVPAGTPLGVYDVTVINGDGQQITGTALLTVLDELLTMDPGPKPDGCQTGGAPGPLTLLLVSLLLLALGRRRR